MRIIFNLNLIVKFIKKNTKIISNFIKSDKNSFSNKCHFFKKADKICQK